MAMMKLSPVLHFAHSKVRRSKPGLSGSMRANRIGLPHPGQFRTPISATLKSGLGWVESMMLPPVLGGSATLSQSPVVAHGRVVIEPVYALGSVYPGQYCSFFKKIRTLPAGTMNERLAAVGSENKGGS
jgi:hypothetical protein